MIIEFAALAAGLTLGGGVGYLAGRRAGNHRADPAGLRQRTVRYARGRTVVPPSPARTEVFPLPVRVTTGGDASALIKATLAEPDQTPKDGDGDPGEMPPRVTERTGRYRYDWPEKAAERKPWSAPVGWMR